MYVFECQKVDTTRFEYHDILSRVAGERRNEERRCSNTTAPTNVWVSTPRNLGCQSIPMPPSTQGISGRSVRFRCAFGIVIPSRTADLGLVTYGRMATSKGRKIQTSALQLSASMLSGPQTGFSECSAPTMTPRGLKRRRRKVSCLGQCCSCS